MSRRMRVPDRNSPGRPGLRSEPSLRARAAVALSGLFVMTAAVASPAAAQGVFFPETFTLSNGMEVVVVVNPRVPVVSHMVMYKVGAADEPRGKSGIAHLLEHLMFKGTDTVAPGEFSREVSRQGGRDNAFTSWDFTGYFQTIAADRLELVMRMEADRMANLRLTDDLVRPEIQVVREERRQTTENNPQSRLGEQVGATLFVHHPYGTPIIGWDHEIAALTPQDAIDFYRTWYAPNNAVLLVSGDVDVARLRTLAEQTYGRVAARPVPARVRVVEPPPKAARRVVLTDPEVRQPGLQRHYLAPSYSRGESRHAYALQILAEIMSGETGRLYRSLVVERKLATNAGMGYSPDAFDLTRLSFSVSPAGDTPLEELEAALDGEIARLLDGGVSAEEVERAKRRLRYAAIYARDSVGGPPRTLGFAITSGQTVADVENWPDRIAAVTREAVNEAARAVLGQTAHVTGILLPATQRRADAARPEVVR
jgi:zinc protease